MSLLFAAAAFGNRLSAGADWVMLSPVLSWAPEKQPCNEEWKRAEH